MKNEDINTSAHENQHKCASTPSLPGSDTLRSLSMAILTILTAIVATIAAASGIRVIEI